MFASTCAKKFLRQGGQQAGTIAAGAVGVHTAAMRQALEGVQSVVDDIVRGRRAETGDEARAAGIVVRMAPVGMTGHTRL